jgi:hypothetical protein
MLYQHYGHLTARVDLLRSRLESLGSTENGTPPARPEKSGDGVPAATPEGE